MISVTGKATFEDYYRAQRNHAFKRDLTIVASLAAIAVLIALGSQDYFFPGFVFAYLLVRPLYIRYRYRRSWDQTPSAHGDEKTFWLDEVGFHQEDDEGNPSITHWDKFLKSRESKHTFFLYLSPHMFFFLPKRFISQKDQNEIRKMVKERIEQKN